MSETNGVPMDRAPMTATVSATPIEAARDEVMRRVCACEQSVGETGTLEEYNADHRALDAYASAIRAATLDEVRQKVEGMRRDIKLEGPSVEFDVTAIFGYAPEGSWLHWPEVLAALSDADKTHTKD